MLEPAPTLETWVAKAGLKKVVGRPKGGALRQHAVNKYCMFLLQPTLLIYLAFQPTLLLRTYVRAA